MSIATLAYFGPEYTLGSRCNVKNHSDPEQRQLGDRLGGVEHRAGFNPAPWEPQAGLNYSSDA